MSMDVYRDQVREAILKRNGDPILNGTVDHAAIIVQEVFASARDCIRILSQRLDIDCYAKPAVRDAARSFFANSAHSLQILVEDQDKNFKWGEHPLLKDVKGLFHDGRPQLEVRRIPREWLEKYKFNFLLMDDFGFRYEADRTRPAAVAAFLPSDDVEKKQMRNLGEIFEFLWGKSECCTIN